MKQQQQLQIHLLATTHLAKGKRP